MYFEMVEHQNYNETLLFTLYERLLMKKAIIERNTAKINGIDGLISKRNPLRTGPTTIEPFIIEEMVPIISPFLVGSD